jgi:hypothetical protein
MRDPTLKYNCQSRYEWQRRTVRMKVAKLACRIHPSIISCLVNEKTAFESLALNCSLTMIIVKHVLMHLDVL